MRKNQYWQAAAVVLGLLVTSFGWSQDVQYAQGLLLDYYVIESADDAKEPARRSMATLLDTKPPQLSYLEPFEIESSLAQFQDKLWGLHWHGYIHLEDAGPYSFNLLMNFTSRSSGQPLLNGVSCGSWLKIQDRVVVNHPVAWYRDNNNAYGGSDLAGGGVRD